MGLSRKKSGERALRLERGGADGQDVFPSSHPPRPPVARVERLWNGWKAGIRKKDV